MTNSQQQIGTLNEGNLHLSLKNIYADDPSQIERRTSNYVVDVLKGDRIIEIQTRGFGALRSKLPVLLQTHNVTLVYPIAARKTIVKHTEEGEISRRLSPKKGIVHDVFTELVYLPTILDTEGMQLEVISIHEEEIRVFDKQRAWRRRGWVVVERRLVEVVSNSTFASTKQLLYELFPRLPGQFTTEDLAMETRGNRALAQKAAYCLRESNAIRVVAKRGNTLVYERS
ncbi:MAG: hypothetical protein OXG24_10735 [Gammaproteobacteria bacterium]|nr:hypothetical protein [Gammaproteobacteria bacterium]